MGALIGITCGLNSDQFNITQYYSQAVEKAGGIPIILPITKNLAVLYALSRKLDGLILAGGGDVDPIHFGEEPVIGMERISPERDFYELELVKIFLNQLKPILGICRGMQVLNIGAGGTIWQDIYTQLPYPILKHNQKAPKWYPTHHVKIKVDTMLAAIFKEQLSLRVNSFHHQGIKKVAAGFRVNAIAPDGMIEGIEAARGPFTLGVQWHPECMWAMDYIQLLLFKELVRACEK